MVCEPGITAACRHTLGATAPTRQCASTPSAKSPSRPSLARALPRPRPRLPAPQVLKRVCWYLVLSPAYSTKEGSSSDRTTLLNATMQVGSLRGTRWYGCSSAAAAAETLWFR